MIKRIVLRLSVEYNPSTLLGTLYQLEQSKETIWPYYCFNVSTTPLLQNKSYFLFHLYIPNKWIYYLMNLTPDFQINKVKHAAG